MLVLFDKVYGVRIDGNPYDTDNYSIYDSTLTRHVVVDVHHVLQMVDTKDVGNFSN